MSEWVMGFDSSPSVFNRCFVSADEEGFLWSTLSKGPKILQIAMVRTIIELNIAS